MAINFDQRQFRDALGSFLTGVTIATTRQADGTPRGLTANSFTSVSLSPPLILFCIGRNSSSYSAFATADHFAIHVLAEDQRPLSDRFASKVADRFAGLAVQDGPMGSPLLDGCCAWFECKVHNRVEAGDHVVMLGEVVALSTAAKQPICYGQGGYVTMGLGQSAVEAAQDARTTFGAILESDGCIAFDCQQSGAPKLPKASALGPASDSGSLLGVAAAHGLNIRLQFLYSVYRDELSPGPDETTRIFYRGTVNAPWPHSSKFKAIAIADIPWDSLQINEARMLRRYLREREDNIFGIYSNASEIAHSVVSTVKS
jgi:flavin reductase (DIM6/NTAB) family NADH-FMN oxidoreductase RutF